MTDVTIKTDKTEVVFPFDEYRMVLDALRTYGDFLDAELRNAHAVIAVPEAEDAAADKITDKLMILNTIRAKFNMVSVTLEFPKDGSSEKEES